MDNQKVVQGLLSELFGLGARAAALSMNFQGTEDEEVALDDFVAFIESVPEKVRHNPALVHEHLATGLTLAGVTFGDLDQKRICSATGYALGSVGRKHPEILEYSVDFIEKAIKGGRVWGKDEEPAAQNIRNNALEIFRLTMKYSWISEKPEWLGFDWVFTVTSAAVLPFHTDAEMIGKLSSYPNNQKAIFVDRLAAINSVQAREALEDMILLDPHLSKQAYIALDCSKKIAESLASPQMLPFALAAAEHTRRGIDKAVKKSAKKAVRPPQGMVKQPLCVVPLDILVM